MADDLGFIVIEYNQVSKWPDLNPYGSLHSEVEGARYEKHGLEQTAREHGRRETYALARVTLIEDGDSG